MQTMAESENQLPWTERDTHVSKWIPVHPCAERLHGGPHLSCFFLVKWLVKLSDPWLRHAQGRTTLKFLHVFRYMHGGEQRQHAPQKEAGIRRISWCVATSGFLHFFAQTRSCKEIKPTSFAPEHAYGRGLAPIKSFHQWKS